MNNLTDDKGNVLAVGDRIIKTAIDRGAPAYAHKGRVVGFTRSRVLVEWDAVAYDYSPDADHRFAFSKPHAVSGQVIRLLPTETPRTGEPS